MGGFAVLEERTKAAYGCGDDFQSAVDLFGGGEAGERKTQAGVGFGRAESHGQQDVRGFGGSGLTGGAEAGGDALYIQRDEERFGVDAFEVEVSGIGDAWRCGGVEVGVRNGCEEAAFEAIAESGELCGFGGEQPLRGEFGGAAEGYDAGDVLGAGAALAFVRPSVEERGELDSLADEEDASALRRVHLVAGEREQIDVLELTGEVDG